MIKITDNTTSATSGNKTSRSTWAFPGLKGSSNTTALLCCVFLCIYDGLQPVLFFTIVWSFSWLNDFFSVLLEILKIIILLTRTWTFVTLPIQSFLTLTRTLQSIIQRCRICTSSSPYQDLNTCTTSCRAVGPVCQWTPSAPTTIHCNYIFKFLRLSFRLVDKVPMCIVSGGNLWGFKTLYFHALRQTCWQSKV